MKKIRIGSGAGYAGDRIEPALNLIKEGDLHYIIFECLAERTIALAQKEKASNPNKGYNNLLEYRMKKVIPLLKEHPVKIVTNMGAANPYEAAKKTKQICEENGLSDLKIAYILGDDIYNQLINYKDYRTIESGNTLKDLEGSIISGNAYIGAQSIVDALRSGADIIITGRASDPSLTVGPLMYEFSKEFTDYNFLAKASVAGHLLECGAQVTGGYYANLGNKKVDDLWNIGFPIIEFDENGSMTVEKLKNTGGLLSTDTVKEQLIYEIHDPKNYLTPDVIVDFSNIEVQKQDDKISIFGIVGKKNSGKLKVSVGYDAGYIAEGEISYGGSECLKLAELASEVVERRIEMKKLNFEEIRTDYIGINSLYSFYQNKNKIEIPEVRLRKAIRTSSRDDAKDFCFEIESLYTNGPAAGGGIRTQINEIVAIESILVDVEEITTTLEII